MSTIINILQLTLQHLYIVLISVSIAACIAIPAAIFVYKRDFHVSFITNVVSLLQAFPALGLFAIFVPIIGIGMKTVIISLILYALLPIFQNTIIGFKNINPEYYEVIHSLGISKKNVFYKIELPLIMSNVINGLRLAIIYTISFATIGTLVGAGGLGDLIYLGLQSLNLAYTFEGIIPLLLLTICANVLFNKIEVYFYTADYQAMLVSKEELKTNE